MFGDTRSGLEISTKGLAVHGYRPSNIPFVDIARPANVGNALFRRSVIEILLMNGEKMVFGGIVETKAIEFVRVFNETWQKTWRQEVEPYHDTIQLLVTMIDRLESPRNFPAACLVEPFRQKAEDLFRLLPEDIPEDVLMPKIQECLAKVKAFHEKSNRFRDRAVENFMERELGEMACFFESIEKNPLTLEQRQAVVCDEDATLVLAGAGSGKTSVITAKATYLVNRRIRKPEEILLLAYGKEAAEEMSDRIRHYCNANVSAMTFHKLAYGIIEKVEGRKPPLASHASDHKALQMLLKKILLNLAENDKQIDLLLLRWFSEFLMPANSEWDFESKHEYYCYVENRELRTLQGELVRSFEELEIANWLCMNGIVYEYEPVYEYKLPAEGRGDYKPDFRLTESGIYIEHFGVRREQDENGNEYLTTAPYINRAEYLAGMEWKRAVHARHGTTLVETYSYENSEGSFLTLLQEKLAPHVIFNPVSLKEILSRLEEIGQFDDFTKTLSTFLRHFKGSGSTIEECRNKINGIRDTRRGLAFLEIFKPVYLEYQKRLGENVDFDDMISRATAYVRDSRYKSPYRHLLVDEFQDISKGRAYLLIALRNQNPDCRIFAVGDDWQSIYRFSGSDIHFMREFGCSFGGTFGDRKDVHRIVDLGRTFRSVDRIAHAARRFILKNPSQIKKAVIPAGTAGKPAIQIVQSVESRSGATLEQTLAQLQKQTNGGQNTVLLVGRYNRQHPAGMSILRKRYPDLRVSFKSIHASKGLEADHVIILGASCGRLGLPSEIIDDPLLDLVLPEPEPFKHAEERRVFYVALTRARKSVTIIARQDQPSDFVNELLDDEEYGVSELTGIGQVVRRRYRCSKCKGHMISDNQSGYYCEHRINCGARLPACSVCGSGIPLRNKHLPEKSQCDCGAIFSVCPYCVDGWLVERHGKYGRFFGCVNYPRCTGRKFEKRKTR